ncbi:MAG: phosphoribosylformylglycinamidine cyclo-ligase [Candidatus Omnitrophica bacterium]|nr:phosphoribosylformylglycinamidine cyclo-ligase [Candidatus Omnitrophota bacterium]
MKKATYKNSGVDIQAAGVFKGKIKSLVRNSFRPEVLTDIGGFGSFFKFPSNNLKEPVLVSSADGIGTKIKIAILANKHDTVGIDAVAMNVNDILCTGAEPLFFLDYIAHSSANEKVLVDLVKGINQGCIEAGCSLIGGETAQMPGMYKKDDYDVAGFCVGVVERSKIIDGKLIESGNVVIGLESNGLHSNGYSLVRKVLSLAEQKRMSSELLRPTRIYVKPVLSLLQAAGGPSTGLGVNRRQETITGISHITGGAFYDKIARILPDNLNAVIKKNSWPVPKIFKLVQNKGSIADKEMYHTLNMVIGMVLIVKKDSVSQVTQKLAQMKLKSWVIGEVVKGRKEVEII